MKHFCGAGGASLVHIGGMMKTSEYWIGEGIDYDGIWDAFEDGAPGYIGKFRSMKVHVLRIELAQFAVEEPLFNHEAVFKTIKGYFHDLKRACLTRTEYNEAGPLFLYSVDRGSGIWTFLGELRQLILLGTTLADEKTMGQRLENLDKRMEILKKHFGNAVTPSMFQEFMNAKTPRALDRAIHKLTEQGIRKIEISAEAFQGRIQELESSFVDLREIARETDEAP